MKIIPIELGLPSKWWDEINESVEWQDGIFYSLCAAFALVSSVALIQLIRIQLRVPEYGWTTQKVFHLMNFVVNGVRAIVFGFHKQVFLFHAKVMLSAFDTDASLDVLDHPVLNLIYYMLMEILPSALVLYILRKLPPKRVSAEYHPIR